MPPAPPPPSISRTISRSEVVRCARYCLRECSQRLLDQDEGFYQTHPQRPSPNITEALAAAGRDEAGSDSELSAVEDEGASDADPADLAAIMATYCDSDLSSIYSEDEANDGPPPALPPPSQSAGPKKRHKQAMIQQIATSPLTSSGSAAAATRRGGGGKKRPPPSDPKQKIKEAARRANGSRDRHKRGAPRPEFRAAHASAIIDASDAYKMDAELEELAGNPSPYISRRHAREGEGGQSEAMDPGYEPPQLDPDVHPRVHELVAEGYRYIANKNRAAVIVDRNERIIAARAQLPKDTRYAEDCKRMSELIGGLQPASKKLKRKAWQSCKRSRGAFPRWNFGLSFGGGQKRPMPLSKNWKQRKALIRRFFRDASVRRVVKHVQKCFKFWFPEVFKYYEKLSEQMGFTKIFTDLGGINIVFAAQTLNLGPQVACYFHRDFLNFPPGICTVVPFGDFNYRRGGQLIMVEPQVIIELQPGDVMMFPSSLITHGNIPLSPNEIRRSWAFYTAGGVVRWVDAGEAKVPNPVTDGDDYAWRQRRYEQRSTTRHKESWDALLTLSEHRAQLVGSEPDRAP